MNFPKFIVSLLKAWFGEAATKENDWGYDWLPKIVGDHSHMPMFVAMAEGKIKGFLAMGQNPAVGGQNAGYQRKALAKLDWMVVKDLYETETATFWKDSPEVTSGDPETRGDRHRGLRPARRRDRRDGRDLHQHPAPPPVARPGLRPARRRPVRPLVHRPPRPPAQEALRRQHPRARPAHPALTWDYIDERRTPSWRIKDEPSARRILKEMNGTFVANGRPVPELRRPQGRRLDRLRGLDLQRRLRPDAPGAGRAQLRRQPPGGRLGRPGWGFAWPANRRILYNRASADPAGKPWPKEARLARVHGNGGEGLRLLGRRLARGPTPPPGQVVRRPLGRPRRPRLPHLQSAPRPGPSPTARASTSTTAPRRSS